MELPTPNRIHLERLLLNPINVEIVVNVILIFFKIATLREIIVQDRKMMTDMEEAEVKKLQSQIEKLDTKEDKVEFDEAAKKLAEGLLSQYQAQLEQVEKKLDEVRNKQETLLDQMQNENKKLQDTFTDVKLDEMFQTIKVSQGKLVLIKKEMASIHERTFKLKKRALRLQQIKQKEALNREQQREQEIRREQELIGKPMIS